MRHGNVPEALPVSEHDLLRLRAAGFCFTDGIVLVNVAAKNHGSSLRPAGPTTALPSAGGRKLVQPGEAGEIPHCSRRGNIKDDRGREHQGSDRVDELETAEGQYRSGERGRAGTRIVHERIRSALEWDGNMRWRDRGQEGGAGKYGGGPTPPQQT